MPEPAFLSLKFVFRSILCHFYFIYCFGPVKLLELSRDGAHEQKIENRNTVKTYCECQSIFNKSEGRAMILSLI